MKWCEKQNYLFNFISTFFFTYVLSQTSEVAFLSVRVTTKFLPAWFLFKHKQPIWKHQQTKWWRSSLVDGMLVEFFREIKKTYGVQGSCEMSNTSRMSRTGQALTGCKLREKNQRN